MQGVRGQTKRPGEFRTSQNWIGVSLKDATFIPPHHDELASLMGDLEKFIHDEESRVPHLIKIAIVHYQFETIHPFLDGNGRLGRLIIALYLSSFGLLKRPALYLSDYFERNKTDYIDHLMAVRKSDNLKAWLIFFLHGVVETADKSIQVFKDIIALKLKLEQEVIPYFGARRQKNAQALIKHLYQAPIVSITYVAKLLGINSNTAAVLVTDFCTHNILVEISGRQRNKLYVFSQYMGLFTR